MASCRASLLGVFASILFLDVVEARYCYYYYYSGSYDFYCSYYYVPVGTIVGAVIGTLIGIATLVGLLVFFCCIRPRRLAARGTVLQPAGSNVAVVSTTTGGVQYGGGYVNTAAYPPGTQLAYPQNTYPPQQQAPQTGYQPPPPYK
ncbi:uncharacterized protein LOC133194422 [Saccostrea echinata]|uniref:uncharacterized protein LOC133194422 n=1 Tax=Saccostrea echinata TaxID=191078 RepID=UPI002A7F98AD|nr:uncharacterized protein LOC133194422 [Saccostrea echinata]